MVSPKEEKKQETAGNPIKIMNLTFYDTLAKKKGDARGLIVETPKEKRQKPRDSGNHRCRLHRLQT